MKTITQQNKKIKSLLTSMAETPYSNQISLFLIVYNGYSYGARGNTFFEAVNHLVLRIFSGVH